MNWKGGILFLVLIAGGSWAFPRSAANQNGDLAQRVAAHVEDEQWAELAALLEPEIGSGLEELWALRGYGQALANLERHDEAAYYLAMAMHAFDRTGEKSTKASRIAERALYDEDPVSKSRISTFSRMRKQYLDCVDGLMEDGHKGLAQDLLERTQWLLNPTDHADYLTLLEELQSAEKDVDLEEGAEEDAYGVRPIIKYESEHYRLECALEQEVVEALATTMDDIYGSYVDIYFGGDENLVQLPKATIAIFQTWDDMVETYPGSSPSPGLGGWWSPSESKVTCYDTRDRTGSLDDMLNTLFHEASHQFMSALTARGGYAPAWLNEGTACFFEGARALQDRRVVWPDAAAGRLASLTYMMTTDQGPGFETVVNYNSPGSYPGEYYAYGWGIVYYLQEFEDPNTLDYVWRPYYQEYVEKITQEAASSRALFDEIFLRPGNPGGFRSFEDFDKGLSEWILDELQPLHQGPERRKLRLERVEKYLAAADAALEGGPSTEELLARALRDVDFVRTQIDTDLDPRGDLLVQQASILGRLGREGAEAYFLQKALDLADNGDWENVPDELYEELNSRLGQINKLYRSMGLVRNRTRALKRSVEKLLDEYEADGGFPLRAYTLASEAARSLRDKDLLMRAADLRSAAAAAGVLPTVVIPFDGEEWPSIFLTPDDAFEHSEGEVVLERRGSPGGRLCEELLFAGQYEIRGTLMREGNLSRSTLNGVVVAGTLRDPWTIVGVNGRGYLSIMRCEGSGGGITTSAVEVEADLGPAIDRSENPQLSVLVRPEGTLRIQLNDREPIEVELPYDLPKRSHPGIFTKSGRTKLVDFVVEVYP